MNTVSGYGADRAMSYDSESCYDKADRLTQWNFVRDLIEYRCPSDFYFLELGCGTGFFSKLILETFISSRAILVDGSAQMLEAARVQIAAHNDRAMCIHKRFESLDWTSFERKFHMVFSALAIHHLPDSAKWKLFEQINRALQPGGCFIYLDIVRGDSAEQTKLLEYLACKDMQRRLKSYLEVEDDFDGLAIDQIIKKDREVRRAEGDQECTYSDLQNQLNFAGFSLICPAIQLTRIMGYYCEKFRE
jgi:SAM-dependent methyltransferase